MKFTINSKTLEGNLSLLSKEVNKKGKDELSSMVMIEQSRGSLTQTASYDGSSFVQIGSKIEDFDGAGKFCISPDALMYAIKGLPVQGISFEVKESKVELTYQGGKVSIPCRKADKFPDIPEIKNEGSIVNSLDGEKLIEGVRRCYNSSANDEVRVSMSSVYLHFKEKGCKVVATDGKKIVCTPIESECAPCEIIVPKRVAKHLTGVNAKKVGIILNPETKQIDLSLDGYIRICAKAVNSPYPNYAPLLGSIKGLENKAVICRSLLLTSLNRVSYFTSSATKLTFKDNKLTLCGTNEATGYVMTESLPIKYEGEPVSVGLSSVLLSGLLRDLGGKNVEFVINGMNKPVFIKTILDDADENEVKVRTISMLMPMEIEVTKKDEPKKDEPKKDEPKEEKPEDEPKDEAEEPKE